MPTSDNQAGSVAGLVERLGHPELVVVQQAPVDLHRFPAPDRDRGSIELVRGTRAFNYHELELAVFEARAALGPVVD